MEKDNLLKLINSKKFMLLSFVNTKMESQEPLHASVTWYFLQAIVLELIIKIFYELEHKKQAPFTHEIYNLYEWFSTKTKEFIEKKYNDARIKKQIFFRNNNINDVIIHELKDVLKVNPQLIKDFKYNAIWAKANYAIDWLFLKEIFDEIDERIVKIK